MNLKNKTVLFLGSSVTYGDEGVSFAEILEEQCGLHKIKEAVSGTTLADQSDSSYVARLKKVDVTVPVDLFICQLSTNDAYGIRVGNFTLAETEAAIRFILTYVKQTWNCPIVFYTSPRFESDHYPAMVELLHSLRNEYDFSILDFWNDPDMNSLSPEETARYMKDPVHPSVLGYKEWWTPKFLEFLV